MLSEDGATAYLVHDMGIAAVNVTNPAAPGFLGAMDVGGSSMHGQHARSIAVRGDVGYVILQLGSSSRIYTGHWSILAAYNLTIAMRRGRSLWPPPP